MKLLGKAKSGLVRVFAWARRGKVRYIRYFLVAVVVLVAVIWFVGSRRIDSWQSCETVQRGSAIKKSCEPLQPEDLIWAALLVGLLASPDATAIKIPGFLEIVFKPRSDGSPAKSTSAPLPRDRFLAEWQGLDGWSRLASKAKSPQFKTRLGHATTKAGTVDRKPLTSGDRDLLKELKLGTQFSGSRFAAWADQAEAQLNELRVLANPSQTSTDAEYEDGIEAAQLLLSELQELGLRG